MLLEKDKAILKAEVLYLLINKFKIHPKTITQNIDQFNIVLNNWFKDLDNEDSHLLSQDIAENISKLIANYQK